MEVIQGGPRKTRTQRLTDALLAERQEHANQSKRHDTIDCPACGHSFIKRGSRCCSPRCEEWLAGGNPPYDPYPLATANAVPLEAWRIIKGPPGCINSKTGDRPFASVCDQITERQRSRRQTLGHDADHKLLKRFMVAADIPFKSENIDYLPKGWKSVLRRPAWSPTAKPSANSDWRISGEWGSVFVDGENGYHLSVETRITGPGSFLDGAPEWADVKRRLDFCRVEGMGLLHLKGLPTPRQAVAICAVLGIPRERGSGGKKAVEREAAG